MGNHKKISDLIFKKAGKVQTEVLIWSSESALTRFADNVISQNVFDSSVDISIRMVKNGKTAKVSLNQFKPAQIEKAVKNALYLLSVQKQNSHALNLIKPTAEIPKQKKLYDKTTAGLSPEFKALKIKEFVKKRKSSGQIACGTLSNGRSELSVSNNLGLFNKHKESFADFEVTVRDGDGFGWAQSSSHNVKDIDFKKVGERAAEKAKLAKNPQSLKPGKYSVILEPAATADLLSFLAYYGFNCQAYIEGRSFLSGNLGKKVFGENVSLYENALDGPAKGMPFDYEGLPKKKLTLIEKGAAKQIPFDRKNAKKAKAEPTGHSLPLPNSMGAFPLNVFMLPGKVKIEEMIKETKKGILVTQFHYTNILRAKLMEMTGMTRNGTYLVENGKIKRAVKNMRFTESLLNVFNNIEAVSAESFTSGFYGGKISAPAIKAKNFNFSSTTKF